MLDRKYPSPGSGSGLAIGTLSPPTGASGRPAYLVSSSPAPSPLATPTRSTFADRSSYLQPPAAALASPLSPSASPASTATAGAAATGRGYVPPPQHRPTTSSSTLRRKIDRSSLVMLAFPLVNLAVILPLSVYRLSALAGRQGSPQALAACGVIFALGGFANCTMYCLTRVSRAQLQMSPTFRTDTAFHLFRNSFASRRTPRICARSRLQHVSALVLSLHNTPGSSQAELPAFGR